MGREGRGARGGGRGKERRGKEEIEGTGGVGKEGPSHQRKKLGG